MQDTESKIIADINAEAALLGSIVLDTSVFPSILDIVKSDRYFSKIEHRNIFNAAHELWRCGKTVIDLVILRDQLKKMNLLTASGGVDYLYRAMDTTPTAANGR